ncbi:MAG: hypothetical protein M1268_03590 [Patescibacteria group bacterium]|nr:hypothetical protein [Patescibacteria group bacterium]
MTKKQFRLLAEASYTKNKLDSKKVEKIVKLLPRKDTKMYIKALKNKENKTTVSITLPRQPKKQIEKLFKNMYPNKKIIYNIDSSLIVGVKVIDNDLVYEENLKDTLRQIADFVSQNASQNI